MRIHESHMPSDPTSHRWVRFLRLRTILAGVPARLVRSVVLCACVFGFVCLIDFQCVLFFFGLRVETEHVHYGGAEHREVEIIRHHLHRTAARDARMTHNLIYGYTAAESSVKPIRARC